MNETPLRSIALSEHDKLSWAEQIIPGKDHLSSLWARPSLSLPLASDLGVKHSYNSTESEKNRNIVVFAYSNVCTADIAATALMAEAPLIYSWRQRGYSVKASKIVTFAGQSDENTIGMHLRRAEEASRNVLWERFAFRFRKDKSLTRRCMILGVYDLLLGIYLYFHVRKYTRRYDNIIRISLFTGEISGIYFYRRIKYPLTTRNVEWTFNKFIPHRFINGIGE